MQIFQILSGTETDVLVLDQEHWGRQLPTFLQQNEYTLQGKDNKL